MGQVEVATLTDPTQHCQQIGSSAAFRLFKNNKGEQFQKYDIRYNNDPDFIGKYQHRIKNFHNNIARVYYIGKKGTNLNQTNNKNIDNKPQNDIYEVVIEAVPNRLSDFIALTSQQSLNILLGALKGFQELYKVVGPIVVKDTMIGINHKNQVKVWINSTFPLNYIEESHAQLKNLPKQQKQSIMLKNIIQLVKQRTNKMPAWLNFVQQWQLVNPGSFTQAIGLTNQYMTKNKIYLTGHQSNSVQSVQLPNNHDMRRNSLTQSQSNGHILNSHQQQSIDQQKYHQVSQNNQMNSINGTDHKKQTINFANLRNKAVQHHNLQTSKVIHQEQVKPFRVNSFDNPAQFYYQHSSPNKVVKQGINPFVASIKQVQQFSKQQYSVPQQHNNNTLQPPILNKVTQTPSLNSLQKLITNGPASTASTLIKRTSSAPTSQHQNIIFPAPRDAATLVQMNKNTNSNSNIGLQVKKNVSDKVNATFPVISKENSINNRKEEQIIKVNKQIIDSNKQQTNRQTNKSQVQKQQILPRQVPEIKPKLIEKQIEHPTLQKQKPVIKLQSTPITIQSKTIINQSKQIKQGDSPKTRLPGKIAHKTSSSLSSSSYSQIKIGSILNRNSNAGQIVKRQGGRGAQKYAVKLQLQKVKSQLIENYQQHSNTDQNKKQPLKPLPSSALTYKNSAVYMIKTIDDSDDEQTSRIKLQRSRRLQNLQRSLAESVRLGRSTQHAQLDSSIRTNISRSNSSTFVPVSYRDMKDMLKNIRSKKKPSA